MAKQTTENEFVMADGGFLSGNKQTKEPPRRRVFECISEEPRSPKAGEWYEGNFGSIIPAFEAKKGRYKIFKEVKE